MNARTQPDPVSIFVRNLLDVSSYYTNNSGQPQDLIDFFLHSGNPVFINKVYLELQSRFLKPDTSPLCKLLIIHFFKYTQSAQLMIESSRDYADNFVAFLPTKRWQTAFEFRAVSNLIPSISAVANPLNPEVRSDTLSLMRMINGLESSDPEVFDSAKDVLLKLGRKITPFQNIYLRCIKMPFLLLFLPDMVSNSDILYQAISVYISLFKEFIQRKLNFESHQNQSTEEEEHDEGDKGHQQLAIIGDEEKNHFDLSFENANPIEFLHDVLVSMVQFIRNLKVFPRDLFMPIVDLFHSLGQQEEGKETDHLIARQACVMIFDAFSSFPEYLRSYQIHVISDISINFIINNPIELKQVFTSEENQDPLMSQNSVDESEKIFLKSPLKMLSRFKVTDSRLITVPPIDTESASLLVSIYPRPDEKKETNNATYADQVVNIIRPFQESTFSIRTCRLFLKHLIDFIPYMSEEAHSILIEVLLPNLMKQGPTHQDLIANFLSSISFLSNPDLLQLYLIFVNSFPKEVNITPRLKAVSLSLFILANVKPDENFASISVSEVFDCGKALFLIGEYSQPAKIWGSARFDDTSSTKSSLVTAAEAFQILAMAEGFSNAKDHSRAAREFKRAADAFDLTYFPHDFQVYYLKARHFFESICFQVDLMNTALSNVIFEDEQQFQPEPLSANICDIEELQTNVLGELKGSSLLLHPDFDEVSFSMVNQFIETIEEMIKAIDQGPKAFESVLASNKIIPPPAILATEQPITVENVRIVNPDIEIKGSLFSRYFYLELRGNVTYNLKLFKNDLDDEDIEEEDESEVPEFEKEFFDELEKKKIPKNKNDDDFYFYNKFKANSEDELSSTFSSNYANRGVEWLQNSGMKLVCHVSIPINGKMELIHTQEIPNEGEFSVDFPIIAEYKDICPEGCKSDSGHNMKVTIFFTAVSDDSHYRIGREEKYVYIHEL